MKLKFQPAAIGVSLAMVMPGAADVVYSSYLNTAIPTNFTGVTINVGSGSLNPFFGGVAVANNAALQPFRSGTYGLDPLLNFTFGDTIDSSDLYLSSGPGGSQTHLGSSFTAGQEGYVGFKLNGSNYGWMRVVFTNNTGGAVVKDWSYDNTGSSIVVGGIRQVGQVVTLSSGFTLASAVVNSGGTTNLVKNGSGTNTLSATSTFTGSTTVNEGKLLITGSLANTSAVTVNNGATLGGNGSLAGSVTLNSGATLSAGEGIDILTTGSNTWNGNSSLIFQFSTDGGSGAAGSEWDSLGLNGDLDLSGVTSINPFSIDLVSMSNATTSGLLGTWNANTNATWSGFVTTTGGITGFATDKFLIDTTNFQNPLNGNFSVVLNGSNLDLVYTAVPEPEAALLGGFSLFILLHRRKR